MLLNYVRIFLLLAAGSVFTVYTSGGSPGIFFDLPSLAIAVILPFGYQWILFGTAALKNAFGAGFRKTVPLEDAEKARLFFKTYAHATWFAAVMAVLIGVISILMNLEDKTMLGPNLALALFSLLYAVLVNLLIILPNTSFLKKRLVELSAEI
jgi:flagellar motor component MotA